jgi:DNA primase
MNVEDLLESKGIRYMPKGADYVISCLNPEHADKNPSMRVDQVTGIFNCFSCEYKGNIFTHFGEKPNALQMKREFLKRKIHQVMSQSVGLPMPKGYVPYQGNWRGISPKTYKSFEAFTCEAANEDGSRNIFTSRIVFPIRDGVGDVCAFVGRHTGDGTPKYLNQPAGAKLPLYPQVQPIRGSIMLVEGIYDMLNLQDKGMTNVMCCFGVKNVTEEKLSILQMKGADRIDIFLDNDEAGQKGAEHIIQLCDNLGLQHRRIRFGSKEIDPGALTEKQVQSLKKKLYD